jgi:hypothetical protein
MSRPRSRTAAVVAIFAVALLITGASAAGADTTLSTYHAKADATALNLQVFGQGVTLGVAHSDVADTPKATGRGVGLVLPGDTFVTEEKKEVTGADGSQATASPPTCGPITLPPDFPVLDLASACAAATAAIAGALPTATAEGTVATIGVDAAPLAPATTALKDAIGQAITALKPIFDALPDTFDAQTLIEDVISAITDGGHLLRVTLGPARATSGTTGTTVSSTASAQGALIEVLPRDGLFDSDENPLAPVIKIEVGASSNTVDVNRETGEATVHFDPALVRVTIAPDIAAALSLPDGANVVEVAPGQSQCLGLPAPLDSCITVAGGTQGKTDEGGTHAEAAGVSLHLLTGVQEGIRLDLANTAVEGFARTEISRDAPPDTPVLARTGGTTNTLFGGSLVAVAVGGMMLAHRARRRYELL